MIIFQIGCCEQVVSQGFEDQWMEAKQLAVNSVGSVLMFSSKNGLTSQQISWTSHKNIGKVTLIQVCLMSLMFWTDRYKGQLDADLVTRAICSGFVEYLGGSNFQVVIKNRWKISISCTKMSRISISKPKWAGKCQWFHQFHHQPQRCSRFRLSQDTAEVQSPGWVAGWNNWNAGSLVSKICAEWLATLDGIICFNVFWLCYVFNPIWEVLCEVGTTNRLMKYFEICDTSNFGALWSHHPGPEIHSCLLRAAGHVFWALDVIPGSF